MAHIGMSDVNCLAESIASNWINGNLADVRETISELNAKQAIYLIYLIRIDGLLSQHEIDRLSLMLAKSMDED